MQFATSPSLPARPASCHGTTRTLSTFTIAHWNLERTNLVVMCHRLRNCVVDHVADVGLVDSHSKRHSGTDQLDLAFAPLMVTVCTVLWF